MSDEKEERDEKITDLERRLSEAESKIHSALNQLKAAHSTIGDLVKGQMEDRRAIVELQKAAKGFSTL